MGSDPGCAALSGSLFRVGPYYHAQGRHEASESSVPPEQKGAEFACPWPEQKSESPLPGRAIGNLVRGPSPTTGGSTVCLSSSPISIPVSYTICFPVPPLLSAISFLAPFLTPTLPSLPSLPQLCLSVKQMEEKPTPIPLLQLPPPSLF